MEKQRSELPDFFTEEEFNDIKNWDAWPVEKFVDHSPKNDAISQNTKLKIQWMNSVWVINTYQCRVLNKKLEMEQKNGNVEWVEKVLVKFPVGKVLCKHVKWKQSMMPITSISSIESKTGNKLKKYCMQNNLDWNQVKKLLIKSLD